MIPRSVIEQAFPAQPRMQKAIETLFGDADEALASLNNALAAIAELTGSATDLAALLAGKQEKNTTLTAISLLAPDPGVLEQVQAGQFAVRPIDAADTHSLLTRNVADTRYLGGAHAATGVVDGDKGDIVVTGGVWSFDTGVVTAFARTFLDDANAGAVRSTPGLVTIASSGSASDLTAGTVPAARMPAFSGDAASSAGATVLTFATVNASTGTFGGAKTSPQFSVNGKGLITGVSAITIQPDYTNIDAVPTARFLGRATAATGFAEALTAAQAKTLLAIVIGDVSGWGTGVATALAVNVGSAGAFVAFNGALGTPSSGTLTNCTFPTLNQNTTGSAAKWTTARNLDGQPVDGTADVPIIAPGTHAATSKATPVDADEFPMADSAASFVLKKYTWANVKTTLNLLYGRLGTANAWTQQNNFSNGILNTGTIAVRLENTFAGVPSGTGPGIEMGVVSGTPTLQFYNRTSAAYAPAFLDGSVISLRPAGSAVLVASSTGTVTTGSSNSTGDQLVTGTGAQGYATGSGGTVTQITSKATGVTLSKTNGQIVTHNAALAAAAVVSFTVTNTTVAATDTINLNLASGNVTAGTYRYWIDKVSAGSFVIAIENRSAGPLSEALTFNFAVMKAVTA